jgi:four helix bundle protein
MARIVCIDIFEIIETTALKQDFALKNQINSSAGSIMDNIAEGFERGGNKEFVQFLSVAKASCGEARSQAYRLLDRGYISKERFEKLSEQLNNISGKLYGLIEYLRKAEYRGNKFKKEVGDKLD